MTTKNSDQASNDPTETPSADGAELGARNCWGRSAVFFASDVSDAVEYVLDQAGGSSPDPEFVAAVIKGLQAWESKVPNDQAHLSAPCGRVERNQKEQ